MPKSADAFRTISEVADWLETPAHVLRFWESKFSQVKPVKRAGGRRYYRPADMELLGGIKRLLHDDGMTIKGVQKLLRDRGVAHVAALSAPIDGDSDFIDVPMEQDAPPSAATLLTFPRGDEPDTNAQAPAPAPAETPTEAPAPEADDSANDTAQGTPADGDAPAGTASDTPAPEVTDASPDLTPAETAETPEQAAPAPTEASESADPVPEPAAPPRPRVVTVPDDALDDIDAEPGFLSVLATSDPSLAPEARTAIAELVSELDAWVKSREPA